MRKYLATILIAFLIGLSLACGVTASAATNSGSSADPLAAKSWVDDYVESSFAPLQTKLAELKATVAGLKRNIVLYIGRKDYTVNGESKTMDTAPLVNSDWRTMVPVRFVAEGLGCTVDYTKKPSGATDKVYIRGSSEIVLTIGSKTYTVDGKTKTMDTAPLVNSDWRTMVPVRFVAEGLGCTVDYTKDANGRTNAVYISK